jgi:hypothetical protein
VNEDAMALLLALFKGLRFLLLGAVMLVVWAIGAAVASAKRLHGTSLTMPKPRSYFWLRFGPVAGACALLLLLPLALSTHPRTSAVDVAASSSGSDTGQATQSPSASASETPSPTPTPSTSPTADAPTTSDSTGSSGSTGEVVLAAGVVLPDRGRTPGAVNPSVTQATISQTICVSGWTSTIRPSSSVTTSLKVNQLATGYAYNGDASTADYEEDHLISLELGGAPSAEANLWPEPYNVAEGARVKDRVENKLHALICSGSVSLAAAQTAIATNWWSAYQLYVTGTAAPAPVPAPVPAPAPAPAPDSGVPSGALALCKDGTYSFAAHHQGACSSHGGVAVFYR